MARSDSVRIVCLTEQPAAQSGFLNSFVRRARMPDLVRELSRVAPSGWLDINAGLSACVPDAARKPLVVVVSDLLTRDGVSLGLAALQARQADVVVLHVVSPDEVDPRLAGEVELIDAETNEVLEVGVSLETLSAYRARFAAWLDAREAESHARGVRYARLMTDRPHTFTVSSSDDRRLAAALMADASVFGAELAGGRVAVRTADYDAFTHALPRIARSNAVTLFEVAPTDDSLESVFSYLVRR